MTSDQHRMFTAEIKDNGVEWLLPQNLPDKWLTILINTDAAVYNKEKRGNFHGLITAALCLLKKRAITPEDTHCVRDPNYFSTVAYWIERYIWLLSVESMARMEKSMSMPHFIPVIPYLDEHPLTVDTIFTKEMVECLQKLIEKGPLPVPFEA